MTTAKKVKKVDLGIIFTPTGWEEIAIADKFGMTLEEVEAGLREKKEGDTPRTSRGTSPRVAAARVAVFIAKKREGLSDDDAYKAVMDLSVPDLSEVLDTGDEDEADPLEPTPSP